MEPTQRLFYQFGLVLVSGLNNKNTISLIPLFICSHASQLGVKETLISTLTSLNSRSIYYCAYILDWIVIVHRISCMMAGKALQSLVEQGLSLHAVLTQIGRMSHFISGPNMELNVTFRVYLYFFK